jgi:hypothetical protein
VPAELLQPLFAVVLAVNALFVGLAIRSLWRSRDGEPRPPTWTSRPVPDDAIARSLRARAEADAEVRRSSPAEDGGRPVRDVGSSEVADAVEPGIASETAPVPTAAVGPGADPDTGSAAATTTEPSTPTRAPRRHSTAVPPGSTSRRRFALPPLDEDHDKVSRSIETFLGGAGTAGTPATVPPDPAAIVTVAVIGLAGPDRGPESRRTVRSAEAPANEPAGPAELRAMLERTVRSTARGTDHVVVDRHGRVRVILPGTGEVAAHAYLRRIRAIVEPIAEAALPSTWVVVATATDLDGSVATARRRADRRFAAALENRAGATIAGAALESPGTLDVDVVEPRAAGD